MVAIYMASKKLHVLSCRRTVRTTLSRTRRLLAEVGAVALLLSGSQLLIPAPALASCFSGEQTIFVGNYAQTSAYGVTNVFDVRNRDLDGSCSGPKAWSTAQLGSTSAAVQAEVGWSEDNVGSHSFCYFWEAQNGNLVWGGPCQGSYWTFPQSAVKFRVAHHTDGTFHFYVDEGSGTGWVDLVTLGFPDDYLGNFSHGWPKGETGRSGGTGTGASDDHWALTYRQGSSGSNWVDWSNNGTQNGAQDTMPGWHHCKIIDTRYKIVQNGATC